MKHMRNCRLSVYYILFIFIASSAVSCKRSGKKTISRFQDGTAALVYDYPDMRDTTTYTYLEYYPNGALHKKIPVKTNMIVNSPIWYYPSGKIYESDSLFRPNNRDSQNWDGVTTRFYENGNKWAISLLKNGQKNGLTKVFDTSGVKMKEYFLSNDSIKEGSYEEFYPNGSISLKAYCHANKFNGMMYFFDKNGDTIKYYYCDMGDIKMPYKKWLNGGATLKGKFTDNTETEVEWTWYNKTGQNIRKEFEHIKNGIFTVPQ